MLFSRSGGTLRYTYLRYKNKKKYLGFYLRVYHTRKLSFVHAYNKAKCICVLKRKGKINQNNHKSLSLILLVVSKTFSSLLFHHKDTFMNNCVQRKDFQRLLFHLCRFICRNHIIYHLLCYFTFYFISM